MELTFRVLATLALVWTIVTLALWAYYESRYKPRWVRYVVVSYTYTFVATWFILLIVCILAWIWGY